MKNGIIRKTHMRLLVLFITLIGGCTSYMEFPIKLSSQYDGGDKIPLRAGLYMTKNFKEYMQIIGRIEYHTDVFGKFGEALSKGAESMTTKAFREVVILDQVDQEASKKVNVLITPEIDSIVSNYVGPTATVKIKWTIKDITGKVLYMNTFVGEGSGKGTSFRYPTALENAYTRAIEDHFNKAFAGISKNKWWEGATY
jgi:hypothetical protein